MSKKTRNLIIALVFLAVLLIEPFWGRISAAIQGEEYVTGASTASETDGETGASPQAEGLTFTVSVSCQEALDSQDLAEPIREILPEDGWLLEETELTMEQGTTILEGLKQAVESASLTVVTSGSPAFVESIGGLTNGDATEISGWTYTVNGEDSLESADVREVQPGDQIAWSFVCTWD